MRVLLIQPPFERLRGFKVNYFPINLGQLAACLNVHNYYARVYNSEVSISHNNESMKYSELNRATSQNRFIASFKDDNNPVWQEIKKTIIDFEPDIVGITTMTATFPVALKIARFSKELSKDIHVVFGGCHATVMPESVISKDEVDFVVIGEGDIAFVELCEALKLNNRDDLRKIKGLMFKLDGRIYRNEERGFVRNIDALPFIKREALLYQECFGPESYSGIIGSRGCPYNCSFCSSPAIWKRKTRYRSPEKIVEELNYLREKYKVSRFTFWDDTFTAHKDNILQFCALLKDNKNKFSWTCLVRANTVDDQILDELRSAGCYSVSIGIESGSDRILKLLNKGITIPMVRDAVALIKKKKFLLGSFWIFGLPHETAEDMRMTIDLMKELPLDHLNFCTFTPEPLTELYDYCISEGIIEKDVDWSTQLGISHHSTDNFFNNKVSKELYDKLLTEALYVVEHKNKRRLLARLISIWGQRKTLLRPTIFFQRLKRAITR
ncbi:B12-binding domain-containing radical SAM protein [Candidatus Omnitrophota bacterium]